MSNDNLPIFRYDRETVSSHGMLQSSNTGKGHKGLTELVTFFRDAFQQHGLVSIPPAILQRFKQCPLQGIDCPDIAAFARLFEGARSSNRFRLEAHSFVYTVQILFHLRPNLVQERLLHWFMVSVRLLKDEDEAARRLSDLAGREVDRFAVAKKRATITNKLVPWLLKHFAQGSTTMRLKMIAAQFLFYLLQGDEEAKKVLSLAPPRDRGSLGSTVRTSSHMPLRVLAANLLRETSLANIDEALFRPGNSPSEDATRAPASFIADAQWLHNTVEYLQGVKFSINDSRADVHLISSVKAGSYLFESFSSDMPVTVTDRLSFIVPADQKRPLQILEVPIVADMQHQRSYSAVGGDSGGDRKEVGLRLRLRNQGFSILNGIKHAVDVVDLTFSTEQNYDAFCHAMVASLQNVPSAAFPHTVGGSDSATDSVKFLPRKQSRAVMIDLSQDAVISGNSQLSSPPIILPRKASTSGRIDVSASRDSSVILTSPLRAASEIKGTPRQPESDEAGPLQDTWGATPISDSVGGNEVTKSSAVRPDPKDAQNTANLPDREDQLLFQIAPSTTDRSITHPDEAAPVTKQRLPQQVNQLGPAQHQIVPPAAISPSLQEIKSEALQHSIVISSTATPKKINSLAQPARRIRFLPEVPSRGSGQQPRPASTVLAHSSGKASPSIKSTEHLAPSRTMVRPRPREITCEKTSKRPPAAPTELGAANAGGPAVDWDEDLRADEDDDQNETQPSKKVKAIVPPNTKASSKTKNAKNRLRPAATKKKASSKAGMKQSREQARSTMTSLAVTRSRRATANVSYVEQEQSQEQNEGSTEAGEGASLDTGPESIQTWAESLNMANDVAENQEQPTEDHRSELRAADRRARRSWSPMPIHEDVEDYGGPVTPVTELDAKEHGLGGDGMEMNAVLSGMSLIPELIGNAGKLENAPPEQMQESEVIAGDPSHLLGKQQRANASSATRRSFGSALLDVICKNGVQPLETPQAAQPRNKLLGGKVFRKNATMTALQRSPKTADARTPEPKKGAKDQPPFNNKPRAPTLPQQDLAGQAPNSASAGEKVQTAAGRTALLKQNDMADGSSAAPEAPKENIPMHTYKPGATQTLSYSAKTTSRGVEFRARSRNKSKESNESDARSPSIGGEIRSKSLSPKAVNSTAGLATRDVAVTLRKNDKKRGLPAIMENLQRIKRARRNDPGLAQSHMTKSSAEGPTPASRSPHRLTGDDDVVRKSQPTEPSAPKVSSETEDLVPVAAAINPRSAEQTQTVVLHSSSTQSRPLRASSEQTRSTARPLQGKPSLSRPPTLTVNDLCRKKQALRLRSESPLSQGISSSGEQEHKAIQSRSVPLGTGKHLATEKLAIISQTPEISKAPKLQQKRLLFADAMRKVKFTISVQESADDEMYADEECTDEGSVHAVAMVETGTTASQTSKVDENGSPRLNLSKTRRPTLLSSNSAVTEDSGDIDSSIATASFVVSTDTKGRESDKSAEFGFDAPASPTTARNMQTAFTMARDWGRPSIGVGNILDHTFLQASKVIAPKAFKESVTRIQRTPIKHIQEAVSLPREAHKLVPGQTVTAHCPPSHNTKTSRAKQRSPSFNIGMLDVNVAPDQSSPADAAHVRRLQTGMPPSHSAPAPTHHFSPLSFNTRLEKMVMPPPPPPRKDQNRTQSTAEFEAALYPRKEQSAMMDMETTLVNGGSFEGENNTSPLLRQHNLSSSSSDEEEATPASTSEQAPGHAFPGGQKYWSPKLAERQQLVLEVLEQVSHKLLLRFSGAEEGISSKLSHYHYGGRKILNDLVEQFDQHVTREKETPTPRLREHRKRFEDTITRLQKARGCIRAGPSLNELEESHEKRSSYVLANLEKFLARQ